MRTSTRTQRVYYAEVSLNTERKDPVWRLVIEPKEAGLEARIEPAHPFPDLAPNEKSGGMRVMRDAKDFCERALKDQKRYVLDVLRDVEKQITGHFRVTKIGEWIRKVE